MLYEIHEKVIQLRKAGKRIINFNVGDPDQITDARIIEAAFKSMKEGKTRYGSARGEIELRKKLADAYGVKPDNVIISPGSKWSIFSVLYFLGRGGNIILPTPHWTAYEMMAKELGIGVTFLRRELKQEWKIDTEKLKELIDDKTKLIILSNPDNPTSKAVSSDVLEEIVEIAEEKNVRILSDETYADVSFTKTKSILDFGIGNHIMISSFSKTFAMTGWRIGFTILDEELAHKLTKFNHMTITSLPVFVQEAAITALEHKDSIAKEIKEIYRKRAEMAEKILSKTKLRFAKPDAPFYLFPYCAKDSEKLALDLLEKGVAVAPGTAFGDYREYFRLALTMPDEEIKEGLEILAEKFQ